MGVFDQTRWRDPLSGAPLEPIVTVRTPAGVPLYGALRVTGTNHGYPIVDCVARLTPELARSYSDWLTPFGLKPPIPSRADAASFQDESTVESFGFQWTWNSSMRSEADLRWRVAERFRMTAGEFEGKMVLDAGAGAGDQSRWLLDHGAQVISVDLSSAIDVVADKLRQRAGWFGVQGDITALPFAEEQFDVVYCEGVIPFTRDSAMTVREQSRVLRRGGLFLATHYSTPRGRLSHVKFKSMLALRKRLMRWDRYKLLWLTGTLAALSYLPLLGQLFRRRGLATYSDLMPNFKTTWTNTFDTYGDHAFQRYVSAEEFWSYFVRAGHLESVYRAESLVVARKS